MKLTFIPAKGPEYFVLQPAENSCCLQFHFIVKYFLVVHLQIFFSFSSSFELADMSFIGKLYFR